jgi:membrane fusion protein (multidrug efflux system)
MDSYMNQRVAAAAAMIVLPLFAAACHKDVQPPAPPPPEVGVVVVQPASVAEPYEIAGQVTPFRRVEVRARAEGVITSRPFTEGSLVPKGKVLYTLDRVKYETAHRQVLARYDNAKRLVNRLQPLLAQHAVAQQDVDNAESELESAKAALDATQKDLDDTVVRAEIAGLVGRALMDLGGRVTGPAELLTTIDELDPVYVTFRPSAQQLLAWQSDPQARALVQPDSKLAVQVVLPDGSLLGRTGRLNYVAPALDAATGTQEFRAVFSNADHKLLPGQFVQVRLNGFARSNTVAIPQRAVQQGLGRQYVYVVAAGDTARMREVQPGQFSGSLWIIKDGLSAGDRVIADGTQKVVPGRKVKPVPAIDVANDATKQSGGAAVGGKL